ncbi:hypothetical protein AHF37_02567 [Paragonimus kellicotti]|nr:hypothetical protein AHF37_02567 [Paragonimus kellicotti]
MTESNTEENSARENPIIETRHSRRTRAPVKLAALFELLTTSVDTKSTALFPIDSVTQGHEFSSHVWKDPALLWLTPSMCSPSCKSFA